MNNDLISREALLKAMEEERQYLLARGQRGAEHIIVRHCLPIIDNAPTADDWESYSTKLWKEAYERGKADRPTGEWMKKVDDVGFISYICSSCGFELELEDCSDSYYCTNCGAKMKERKNE